MMVFDQLKKSDPRLQALTVGVFLGMLVLLAGLWWVQIVSSGRHTESQVAQSFRTVRIPAIRGRILDRNNQPLAENRPSYDVCLYLDELRDEFKAQYSKHVRPEFRKAHPDARIRGGVQAALEREARYRAASNIVHHLSQTIRQPLSIDPEEFHRHYQSTLALPMPLARNLDRETRARFLEQPSASPGVDLEVQPTRYYPLTNTAAHIIGYLTRDTQSTEGEEAFVNFRLQDYSGRRTVGIERAFDETLRGKGGVKSVLVNSLGYRQSETVWTPAEPGKNVKLTLDTRIQMSAESHLQNVGISTRGAVVVMDPNNGDILAMASAPSFDPNAFFPSISQTDWDRLMDKEQRPMINRAIQENYPPGSIFKIVSGLACLEVGLNPHTKIENPGYIYVGRRLIDDLAMAGPYDFRRAFLKSSNTYFITNALIYGPESIARLSQKFHLGGTNGIPTTQEVPGHVPSPEQVRSGWFPGDTANFSIGQGPVDVTPLQVAILVSAIANGGIVYKPRLVSEISSQDAESQEKPLIFEPGQVRNHLGVDPKNLRIIQEAMVADVEDREGTGAASAVPGVRVCGKTGTAQITDPQGRAIDQITWFASYAPYENPRFVVVVMVESGFSGGSTCAPVAAKIYRDLQDLNLLPKPPNPAMVLKR